MSIRFGICLWFFLWVIAVAAQSPPGTPEALNPATPAEDLTQAVALYRSGKFAAAAEKYRQILTLDAANATANAGLTRSLLKENNIDEARTTINKALQGADSPPVHVALGEVEFREGLIADAEREWVSVVNSSHPDSRAYLGLTRVSDALSLYKRGRRMLERAHELDPDDADVRKEWMGTLKISERIKYLEEYLSRDNADDPELRAHMKQYLEYLEARQSGSKGGCRLVSKLTSTEARLVRLMLDAQHLRGYGLEVAFGDQKSTLLLDTGAGGIVVNRRLAQKAGLQRLSEATIGGFGDRGDAPGYVALAPTIKVGGLEFQNCSVEVMDRRSVADESGLIGTDVFRKFLVDLDFAEEKLRLSELPKRPEQVSQDLALSSEEDEPELAESDALKTEDSKQPDKPRPPSATGPFDRYVAPEMKNYSQVFRFGHLLLVPTRINAEKIPKLFLIDSGGFTTLSLNAAKTATKVHDDPWMSVKGLSGKVNKVYAADQATLQFARFRLPVKDITALDMKKFSDDVGTEMSGVIGFDTLRFLDIKIDYRDGLIYMEYKGPQWLVQ